MKKKILIDLERLRYPFSGIANVFRNLAKGLAKENQDLDIFYFSASPNFYYDKNKHVKWQKWHKFIEVFSQKFDLIHVSHQLSSYFHKNYKNSIKVLTLHDLNFLHEDLTTSKREKMLDKVRKNVKNADYIVCISEYAKQDLIDSKSLFNFSKLKDIIVIHNGISFPEDRTYNLGKYTFLKDQKYILNIGVLFDKKKQISLVEMLPYVEEDLVLIASDEKQPYGTELRKRIKNLDLEKRVHILKGVSEEEKYAIIQNCEAMCHPSIAEGFGIPPIEAMAFSKPVFLSKFTSLPEIGGHVAFYFDDFDSQNMAKTYKEKMDFFSHNKEEYQQDIKKWTQQFDYKVMSKNYLDFYRKILIQKKD